MDSSAPRTLGVHHVGLTVRDVETAAGFFEDALGFTRVGGRPSYPAVFVSDGTTMITLWQASAPEDARDFDRHGCVGLHHLALRVDPSELGEMYTGLAGRDDVEIEFGPEPLGSGGARHLMFSGPSGLRLELIAPGG